MSKEVFYPGVINDMDTMAVLTANTWPIVLALNANFGLRVTRFTALNASPINTTDMAAPNHHVVLMGGDNGIPVLRVGFAPRYTKKGDNRGPMFFLQPSESFRYNVDMRREAWLESVQVKYMLKNLLDPEVLPKIKHVIEGRAGMQGFNEIFTHFRDKMARELQRPDQRRSVYVGENAARYAVAYVAGMIQKHEIPEADLKNILDAGNTWKLKQVADTQFQQSMQDFFSRTFYALGTYTNSAKPYWFAFKTSLQPVANSMGSKPIETIVPEIAPHMVPDLYSLDERMRGDLLGKLVTWKVKRLQDLPATPHIDPYQLIPATSDFFYEKATASVRMPYGDMLWSFVSV